MSDDDFFVGWRERMPRADRRAMLGAGIGLLGAATALGAIAGRRPADAGGGSWNQGDVRTWTGVLIDTPYPALRWDDAGTVRTAWLATGGKTAVRLPPHPTGALVRVRASLIARGRNAMLAVGDGGWLQPADPADRTPALLEPVVSVDRGAVMMVGEILDAKCWFGAMRPGYGKTHKACAALCLRGGLPIAFCPVGTCDDDTFAPLLLTADGAAHGRALAPLAGEPVMLTGRLVEVGDVLQLRADTGSIRRV